MLDFGDLNTQTYIGRIQSAKTPADLEEIGAALAEEKRMNVALDFDKLRKEYARAMSQLRTYKVVGTSKRQDLVRRCRVGDFLMMVHDPMGREIDDNSIVYDSRGNLVRKVPRPAGDNGHNDPKAVMLVHEWTEKTTGYTYRMPVGYLPKEIAETYYEPMAQTENKGFWQARVAAVAQDSGYGKGLLGLRVWLPPARPR